jgi:hypothetical protein
MKYRVHLANSILTEGVKCRVATVNVAPFLTSVLLYYSGPSGSFISALLSFENWEPLKPVLVFHYAIIRIITTFSALLRFLFAL